MQLWDIQAPSTTPINFRHDKIVNALAFSPDDRTLATVGDDGALRLWDMKATDPTAGLRVLRSHHAAIVDIAFSRDGRWLATGSKDGTARLTDLAAAGSTAAGAILPNGPDVNTLAFSPDNHWLATGSSDGKVRLWDILLSPNPLNRSIQRDIEMDARKVAFSPNSQSLAVGDTESYRVALMRITAPDKPFFLKVHQWVLSVAFSPDAAGWQRPANTTLGYGT